MDYHERAVIDIEVAKHYSSPQGNPNNDEGYLDVAAYHVQQGIEKILKHVLRDILGMSDESRSFRTHDIDSLISQVEGTTDLLIPDDIKIIAADVTTWEAGTRYGSSQLVELEKIHDAIRVFEHLLELIDEWKGV